MQEVRAAYRPYKDFFRPPSPSFGYEVVADVLRECVCGINLPTRSVGPSADQDRRSGRIDVLAPCLHEANRLSPFPPPNAPAVLNVCSSLWEGPHRSNGACLGLVNRDPARYYDVGPSFKVSYLRIFTPGSPQYLDGIGLAAVRSSERTYFGIFGCGRWLLPSTVLTVINISLRRKTVTKARSCILQESITHKFCSLDKKLNGSRFPADKRLGYVPRFKSLLMPLK